MLLSLNLWFCQGCFAGCEFAGDFAIAFDIGGYVVFWVLGFWFLS